jgi:hypothetical protein
MIEFPTVTESPAVVASCAAAGGTKTKNKMVSNSSRDGIFIVVSMLNIISLNIILLSILSFGHKALLQAL